MKTLMLSAFIFFFQCSRAQELYVFTEPASNMAAKSIGIRVDNLVMKDLHKGSGANSYHLMPNLMWGVSKRIMLHFTGYLSNMDGRFTANGGSIYGKYRFFSKEDVHDHSRMAAFAQYSLNNSYIHEYAMDLNGHNSGYEAGLIATRLHKKTAFSASASFMHATDNINEKFLFGNKLRNAIGYSVSAGRLMLPKEYTSYKQTNLNLVLEFLGQCNVHNGFSWLDIAPAVQLIFNSRARLDLGYRYPLVKKLQRYSSQGALLRLEYNFFNIY
jgi:hypothetical protein